MQDMVLFANPVTYIAGYLHPSHIHAAGSPWTSEVEENSSLPLTLFARPARAKHNMHESIYHLASPAPPVKYMYNPVKTIKTNTIGSLNMLGKITMTSSWHHVITTLLWHRQYILMQSRYQTLTRGRRVWCTCIHKNLNSAEFRPDESDW